MDWEYKCCRCGKEYSVMHPEVFGFDNICGDCWTDADSMRLAAFTERVDKEESERQKEQLASTKLEKIPKWIRQLFGA